MILLDAVEPREAGVPRVHDRTPIVYVPESVRVAEFVNEQAWEITRVPGDDQDVPCVHSQPGQNRIPLFRPSLDQRPPPRSNPRAPGR